MASRPLARSLGRILREQRVARGLSPEMLSGMTGIAASTIRRWEAGQTQPYAYNLHAVCTALGMTPDETVAVASLIEAPRAKAAAADAVVEGLTYGNPLVSPQTKQADFRYWMPLKGDLWKALRMRRKMQAGQLAQAVGVWPSRVTRWEQSELAPPEEMLPHLFDLLGASADERMALSDPSPFFRLPADTFHGGIEDMSWEERVFSLHRLVHTVPDFPGDLYLRALEAELAPSVVRDDSRSKRLLGRVFTWHADWLHRHGRDKELGHPLERAGGLLARGDVGGGDSERPGESGLWAHWVSLYATHVIAPEHRERGRRNAYDLVARAIEKLRADSPRIAEARMRLLREITALMPASAGTLAHRYLDESKSIADRLGDTGAAKLADIERLYVHLAAGQTEEAIRLLPPLTDPDLPGSYYSGVLGERVHHIKVRFAAGDLQGAKNLLDEYERLAQRFQCFGWGLQGIPEKLRN